MSDVFTKKKRSEIMAAVRSCGNKATEQKLIATFRKHKIAGWRRHLFLPGRPDFVFPKQKVAVFVDGCFWHGCPRHLRMPKSNVDYWNQKIGRNMLRDKRVGSELRKAGWKVIRFWEHQLNQPTHVINRLLTVLN